MTRTTAVPRTRDRMTGYVYVAIAVSTLGGLIFGYDIGVSGGAGGFVASDLHLGSFLQGAVVSGSTLGGAIGALAGGPMADRFGRRWTLLLSGVLFSLGALVSAIAPDLSLLMLGRVVVGLGVGAASVLVPVYIAELAPSRVRGALVAGFQLLTTLGILVGYGVNASLASTEAWRWSLGLAAVPGILLALGVLLIPESPRWLVVQGRHDDALRVLRRIRGRDDVSHEIDEIEAINREDASTHRGQWRDMFRGWVRPMVVVGILVAFFANACGINLIVYFAPQILQSIGMGASASLLATVGLGVVNVVFTGVGMALVDRVGRRPMLLVGAVGMTVSLGALAILLAFPVNGSTAALSLICLALYIVVYAVSPGLVAYVVISEIFPLHVRAKATAAATFVIFATNLVIGVFSLPLLDSFGAPATLSIFAVVCLVFVFFCLRMPETKGKTLEELEEHFRTGSPRAVTDGEIRVDA
ncbi:sugar porter family MFS transporter [Curtobacterium sp. VKM Ac-1376]|uniref:sugar porter family MFS transporter n=1 Tax=Curtobacterium sp. VKM Ac-1376 TaxID=123312 RepID=UPI00188B9FB7|nr:sugar porter family MFS transporter [Curtobacterium sp. VKM Ac-1376]MBF4612961.1 sugar porter family MFS transporter [Curtobacterium sp. VKM Ac-1376]